MEKISDELEDMLTPGKVDIDYDIFDSEPSTWNQVNDLMMVINGSYASSIESSNVMLDFALESDLPTKGANSFLRWLSGVWKFILGVLKKLWDAISGFFRVIWRWFRGKGGKPDPDNLSGDQMQTILRKTNPDKPFKKETSTEGLSMVKTIVPDEDTIMEKLLSPERGRFEMHPWHLISLKYTDLDNLSNKSLEKMKDVLKLLSEESDSPTPKNIMDGLIKDKPVSENIIRKTNTIWEEETKPVFKYFKEDLKKVYGFLSSRDESVKIKSLESRSTKLNQILRFMENNLDKKIESRIDGNTSEIKNMVRVFKDTMSIYSSSEKLFIKISHGYAKNLISVVGVIPKTERIVILESA